MLVKGQSALSEGRRLAKLTSSRATAVLSSKLIDRGEIGASWARLSGTVAHTVAEVLVCAETGDIRLTTAAQGLSKTEHGLNTVLLFKK